MNAHPLRGRLVDRGHQATLAFVGEPDSPVGAHQFPGAVLRKSLHAADDDVRAEPVHRHPAVPAGLEFAVEFVERILVCNEERGAVGEVGGRAGPVPVGLVLWAREPIRHADDAQNLRALESLGEPL